MNQFENTNPKTVELLDSNGKQVRIWENVSAQTIQIERNELTAGKYIISVFKDGKVSTVNLMVR